MTDYEWCIYCFNYYRQYANANKVKRDITDIIGELLEIHIHNHFSKEQDNHLKAIAEH